MSLSIDIITELPDDDFVLVPAPYGVFDGVGTERLWTAPVIRELGATFLPRVGGGFLRIRPAETGAFLHECATLLTQAPKIIAATRENKPYPAHECYVERNLTTMIYMTYHARRADDGLVIW